MIVNVVEAVCPSFLPPLLDLDDLSAKAAPEPYFTVAADPAVIYFAVDHAWIGNIVISGQVKLELLAPMAGFSAELFWIDLTLLIAFPQFELVVLTVFMPFPVIFAAKPLETLWKRTAIRLVMAFLVFSASRISRIIVRA